MMQTGDKTILVNVAQETSVLVGVMMVLIMVVYYIGSLI